MKKIILLIAIIGSLLLCAGACAEADMTLLVYMCGADIQSDACEDIYEMGIAETGENIILSFWPVEQNLGILTKSKVIRAI